MVTLTGFSEDKLQPQPIQMLPSPKLKADPRDLPSKFKLEEGFIPTICLPVVLLSPLRVTEVAEIVIPAQVFEQLVIVQVPLITEFAEGVAPVGGVIGVPMDPVPGQVLPGIPFPLVGEDLQSRCCVNTFVFMDLYRFLWTQTQTEQARLCPASPSVGVEDLLQKDAV